MERSWRAVVEIPAPPEQVWDVLTDFAAYPAWNPFTVDVACDGVIGHPVRMRVDLGWAGVRAQRETLRELGDGRLVWGLELGADALLGALRTQTVVAWPGGARYETIDRVFGVSAPLVDWCFGGVLQRGFEGVASGLRAEVLRRAASRICKGQT